jgi:REP element-mobilizing transposase RayT
MILAFHIIFAAYGFWLPNDPRGSWSDFVASWELLKFGKPKTVTTRRSLAYQPHDRAERLAAKEALKYPPVLFNDQQALAISRGFQRAIMDAGYVFHALAILPDHVHAVIAWHQRDVRRIIGHLKSEASRQLRVEGIHPLAEYERPDGSLPTPWVEKGWSVYLFDAPGVVRAIDYVDDNPEKEGKPRQRWSLLTPFAH